MPVSPLPQDSIVVHTPLPGGIGTVVRAMLNAPTWLQVAVVVGAMAVALLVLLVIWHYRDPILHWLKTRSRGWKLALAGVVVLCIAGASAFSVAAWDYTQHNNDFCIGCHVMTPAWQRFQHSEHRKLLCHNCHQQSLFASMRQLYLWVAEKPNEIPAHAKVPTQICETCHNQAHPDSVWKRILATAGHSVHTRSDTAPLRRVQCVTCHGAEVHHFVPVDRTCGQSGCHERLRIQLGKMAGQSSLHCTGCHSFTQAVASNISPDSSRVTLVPTGEKCLACHSMKERVGTQFASMQRDREPHKAVCGACHNPHTQATPKAAFATCQTSGCHARADTLTPFHRGLPAGALNNCGTCHKAHVWKVASTDCVACHRNMGKAPAAVAHAATSSHEDAAPHQDDAPREDDAPHGPYAPDDYGPGAQTAIAQGHDTTFSHARHTSVPCTSCHSASREHGELMITAPRGCQECHHSQAQKLGCANCHPANTLPAGPRTIDAKMTVHANPRQMTAPFEHGRHAALGCRTCHTTPTTLAASTTCTSCHAQHHTAERRCASCHVALSATAVAAHPKETVHAGCGGAGCHSDPAVLALPATRNVCIACHRQQEQHQPGGECAACHLVDWTVAPKTGGTP